MGIQIAIQYHDATVRYNVVSQEDKVYHLKLDGENRSGRGEYIPQKIVIRRKGLIWISDMDNYDELINALTEELGQFGGEVNGEW
jgi:hypothetical protein